MKIEIETLNIDDNLILNQVKNRVANTIVQKYKLIEQKELESFIKEEVHKIVQEHKQYIIKMVSDTIAKSVMKTKAIKNIESLFED